MRWFHGGRTDRPVHAEVGHLGIARFHVRILGAISITKEEEALAGATRFCRMFKGALVRLVSGLATMLDELTEDALPQSYPQILSQLTPRQVQVLEGFLVEPDDARIARRMGLRVHSVRNRLTEILRRLGLRSRAELMKLALLAKLRDELEDRPA